MDARTSVEAPGSGGGSTETDEVLRRILAAYEAGELVTSCAWCGRVLIDGEWCLAPRAALTAIDSRFTLSHSICTWCAAAQPTTTAGRDPARR